MSKRNLSKGFAERYPEAVAEVRAFMDLDTLAGREVDRAGRASSNRSNVDR